MSVILTSKDISKKLKIPKSLVREISKQLEKEAYQFTKNQNTRMYSAKDFTLFQIILENYNKHQNLPMAVQYGLENYQQNEEIINEEVMNEEVPLSQQSIEVAVHIETASNNLDRSSQIVDSTNSTEAISKIEASLNNNETVKPIDPSLHTVKVDVERINANSYIVDNINQPEESPSNLDISVQNKEVSNLFETIDHIANNVEIVEGIEVVEHIVSMSSSNEEVVNQMSTNSLVEQEQPQHNQLQNSMEQLDTTSAYYQEAFQNETTEHSLHNAVNKTDLQQIDVQTDSHKLFEVNEAHSNQIMFEEFMSQISNLATQNELILQQNQTLIQQNLLKDQKLEKILHSVEEKSDELQELASVIEEKDEKLEQMFEEIQVREVSRDAQLMRVIREMQETKKMVAASKEKDWKSSLKSFFIKPKAIK